MEPENNQEPTAPIQQPVSPEPASVQTPPPIPEVKSPRKKWPFIALGVLILIVLLSGGYLVLGKKSAKPTPTTTTVITKVPTPTPDPTADWKSYQLELLSFKAPASWWSSHPPMSISIDLNPTTFSGTGTPPGFRISIASNITAEDLISEIKSSYKSLPAGSMKEESRTNKTIDGKTTIIYKYTVPPGQDVKDHHFVNAYIQSGNDVYVLYSSDFAVGQATMEKYFASILSTFKFTNTTYETANWLSFSPKSEPTLSIKYPPTWTKGSSLDLNSISITSKNGTQISLAVGGNNIGGACSDSAINTINNITPLSAANGLNLLDITYSLKSGSFETLGIDSSSPKIGPTSDCSTPHLIFYSKSNPNIQIDFSTVKLILSDKDEATKILESLKY